MNNIRRWIEGYLDLLVCGDNKERFVTLCKNNNLCIYKLRNTDKGYVFSMSEQDYRKIKKIVKKTHILPRIIDKKGLPFIYSKYKNRQSFVVGLMLGLFIFYVSSLYIWNIKIEGEHYFTDSEILKYLKSENVITGMKVRDVDCNEIEKKIRKEYKDIGWVSAQIEGTYLIITVKENVKININEEKEVPGNIVASVDGVIDSLLVKTGECKVEKGAEVKKGDILISGVIDIVDDSGTVVNKKAVRAEGDVYIRYDKEYFYELPREYDYRKYTGRKKNNYKVWYNKKQILDMNFYMPLTKKIDNYHVMVNNYNVILCKKLYTPITVVNEEKIEYIVCKKKYSDSQLRVCAENEFKKYSKVLNLENKAIIDNKIDYVVDKNGIVAKGYVTIKEKVSTYSNIDKESMVISDTNGKLD